MPEALFCPNCGAEQAAGARFCGKCGYALPQMTPDSPAADDVQSRGEARGGGVRRLALAAAGIGAALLIVFLGWQVGRFIGSLGGSPEATDEARVALVGGDGAEGGTPNSNIEGVEAAGEEAAAGHTPTATATATATATPTATASATATATASQTPEPTPTVEPTAAPSPTPWPTVTPPPAAPTLPPPPPPPPPQPTVCSRSVQSGIRGSYQAHASRLGCATNNGGSNVEMAVQRFEGGRMLWRGDNDQIYVLYDGGGWQQFGDSWREGQPSFSCGVEESPPTPVRGFGKVWCTHSTVRDRLGDATEGERPARGTAQDFANGAIIAADGATFVLTSDGVWR